MTDSATLNRREKRKQETAFRLTSVSRRLTAERGLAGFTIEELCDEVEISRRTFFNYFPSKDDAVLGADSQEEAAKFAEAFLAQGKRGWGNVVDDLFGLALTLVDEAGLDLEEHSDFMRALEREPKLFARFMGTTREREKQLRALIAEREGVAADDPRAEAAVMVITSLTRMLGETLSNPENSRDFATVLTDSLAALRLVLSTD